MLYHAIVQSLNKTLLNLTTDVSFRCSKIPSFKDLHGFY
jgi:hypothetical protein